MIRALRVLADADQPAHCNPKLDIAAKLYRCGFTASDIVEHIDEVLEAL